MIIQTASVRFDFDIHTGTTTVNIRTPHGTMTLTAEANTFWGREHTGMFEPHPEPKPKAISKKAQKRASMRQENEVMEALGGRRQAGSGAVAHLKGDGRVRDKYRVEAKYTRAGSYRVDRKELNKLRGECDSTEIPVFVIDFVDPQTGGSADRWAMVEFNRFQQLDYKPPTHATGNHR